MEFRADASELDKTRNVQLKRSAKQAYVSADVLTKAFESDCQKSRECDIFNAKSLVGL